MSFMPFPFETGHTSAGTGFRPGLAGQFQRAVAAARNVEPTPYDVVYRENKTKLRHHQPETDETQPVPVVICYAFVNTPSILDLEREHSVVGQFLDRGFEVFLVDWGYPSRLDSALDFADYVTRYLHNCVSAAMETAAAERVHLLGYSTGAPVAVMYAGLHSERIQTLVLQGPPVDFDVDGGMLEFRELLGAVDPETVVDTVGNVPPWLVDAGFSVRNPVEFAVGAPIRAREVLGDDAAVETAARKGRWLVGGPDMPAGLFRDFVQRLLVQNQLIENELELDGRVVDLETIESPLLLVLGTDDEYVPAESARSVLDAVGSQDTAVLEIPTGHVGLSIADEAHLEGWPQVCDWLETRSRPDS
jgi:polyhydroxyalkanoate synthase